VLRGRHQGVGDLVGGFDAWVLRVDDADEADLGDAVGVLSAVLAAEQVRAVWSDRLSALRVTVRLTGSSSAP
jgi:hypothetical protein